MEDYIIAEYQLSGSVQNYLKDSVTRKLLISNNMFVFFYSQEPYRDVSYSIIGFYPEYSTLFNIDSNGVLRLSSQLTTNIRDAYRVNTLCRNSN